MNTKTFIVLVAVFAIASAGTLSSGKKAHAKKELNSEAHYQALKETAFGKNLFNMMSLKFKTSGQLDTILELLDELNTNINQQQAEDNANFETKSAEYTETINENTAIVNEANANIDEANAEIDADRLTISQATEARDGFLAQIEGIEELLASLAEIREREHNDFLQRTSDQEAILAGLNEVINLFSAELENDPNLDHDAAEAVLDLLNEIRISVEASLSEDAQKENQAQIDYNNFVEEENAELEDLRSKVDELNQVIEDAEARIETNEAIVASETIRRDNSQQIINDTEAALEELTATHNANTQTRDGQITLIGQVKARLRDNEENVQGFLNNA